MEPGVLDTCTDALRRLEGLGCGVEPIELGHSPAAVWQAWLVLRHWLVGPRLTALLANPANRASIKPEALWEHDQAQGLSAADVMAASIERSRFLQSVLALFERVDVLALPSAQVWPFPAEWRWPRHIGAVEMDTYHRWMEVTLYATFAGLPAVCVPAGFSAAGLPMGLQLIGPPRADAAVLQLAHAYEQAAADVLARRPGEPVPPQVTSR
jgi:amidase